jgi:Tfp pilus assembly protein PilE
MKGYKGFTLTEFIVAVLIFSLTLIALFTTYEVFYRTSKQQIARTQVAEKLRPATEQLERFISDAGYGISKEELDGETNPSYLNGEEEPVEGEPTNVDEANPNGINNYAAIAASADNNINFVTNNSDYNSSIQIHLKSIIGEYPFSGNYVVYDDVRFGDNEDLIKAALGLPTNEQDFSTIVMDINKNIIGGPFTGAPDTSLLENSNIIFVCKKGTESIDDYYYFKTIKLSTNTNEERGDKKYNICNPKTYNLQVVRGQGVPQTLIPCVAYFNADFGCYDNERIKWQKNICTKINKLKIIRIGLIVQNGFINKNYLYSEGDTLTFPTLGRTGSSSNPVAYTIQIDSNNIRNDMRYYKWEVIERIIATSNVSY